MHICNIQENQELAKSIGNYINASIKKSLESGTPYQLSADMKVVYEHLKDEDKLKALGVAAVVPQIFMSVLKLKQDYAIQLLEKGFLMDPIYKFIKDLETAEDPINLTAKILKVAYTPTIAQINNNLSYDSEKILVLEFSDSVAKVITKMLSTNSFFATSGNNRKSINESDSDLNFYSKIQQNLLKAKTDKDPTLESVEYSGHTGFKLRLQAVQNIQDAAKNIPGISLKPGNYVQVIVDNDGNYLYFDNEFNITTEDNGKLAAFPQRNWNKSGTKELFIDSSMRAVISVLKKEIADPAQLAIEIAKAKKEFSQKIDREILQLNEHLDDIQSNKMVLADITGGFGGVITDPDNITEDAQGNKLTKEQKSQLQKPLSEFKISSKALKSILQAPYSLIIDNYPSAIPIKGTLIAEKNPGLLNTLIDLLTEDLVENGESVSAERKQNLFHQFTFPAKVKVSHVNGVMVISVNGAPLNLENKEQAKAILKEALSTNIGGAYFSVRKAQAATNTYEEVTISGNNLSTKKAEYLPFISQYVIPKTVYDKTTGEPLLINGFFTYALSKTKEQDKKETDKIIGNANKAIGNINISGFDRSKLLNSRSNRLQRAAGEAWEKESAILKVKDSVTGKPLIPVKRLQNIINSDAFATFSRAGITLYNGSDSTHMYHEAWHVFSQLYMTYAERSRMYKAVTTLSGSFTVLKKVGGPGVNNIEEVTLNFKDLDANNEEHRRYIEEFIAEEFRTYAMNGGKFKVKNQKANKLESFFRAIWETLKALFQGVLPVNVYSNPGASGPLSEAFNVLYTAKEASDLNTYSPSYENAEFGTLNAGAIYDTDGNILLYPTETEELKKSMDGIISVTINKLIMDPTKRAQTLTQELNVVTEKLKKETDELAKASLQSNAETLGAEISAVKEQLKERFYGAAFEIFTNPRWIKNLYNNVIKEQFKERTQVLTADLEKLNERVEKETDELKKAILQSDADILGNKVNTLSKALANYGNIDGILENKVSDNSIIAYHFNNSAFKSVIKNAINTTDEDEKSPNPLDILAKTGGINANEIEASKLATIDAVYILSSLVKENFVNGVRVTELNELGFPEPIEFTYFFNFLMQKVGGQQTIGGLYKKLVGLKKLKINPLVDQLLDKMGDPNEVKVNNNASRMWFALTRALNPYRTDLVNTKFTTEKGVTTVVTGKVSAPYFTIKNEVWPSKFSMDTSIFVTINKDNQNTIKLSEVYSKFLTTEQDSEGNIIYTLKPKTKASDFLSAIGIYLSDKSEAENRLRETSVDGGLKQIYNIIGHAYKNGTEISDIVKFLSKKNILQGEIILDGKAKPKAFAFPSLNGTVNTLAQIEADLGTEYSNQMVFTSDNEIQSVFSQNSSFTRIGHALNSATDSKEFGDETAPFGYVPHLYPGNNPAAGASVVLNSLYNPFSKTKNEDNNYEITVLSGAQHEVVTENESSIDRHTEGISSGDMSNTDRFVKDISSMLQAGYMEGVANGDKNTFLSGKPNRLYTYENKKSHHLYIDTDAFIIDNNGHWLTRVNPKLEVYNIMIPKLEAELKRIAMYEAGISDEQAAKFGLKEGEGKDFYKKHVQGFENAGKFDFFEDVLENTQGYDIKQRLLKEFLPQLSDTVTLRDLLNKDLDFKKVVGTEIWNYFEAIANQIMEQDYNKVFGNKLPDFLKPVITMNIQDASALDNVSVAGLINAAVMSFAVNSTLHTDEQLIIQFGNAYEFNHGKDEYSKRTSPYNSPGVIAPSDDIALAMLNLHVPRAYEAKRIKDGKINKKEVRAITRIGNKAIIQESIVKAAQYDSFHDLFKNTFIKRGIKGRELDALLYGEDKGEVGTYDNPIGGAMEAFAKVKNADGQGWISFDFYRILKDAENNWSDAQEAAYQKEINGESISAQELVELFPVLKQGYAGPLALGKGVLAVQSIDKFSLLPLVPSLVRDTPFEIIQDKMMEQDTDYMMMPTSAKRSFVKSNALDANGEVAVGDPIFIPGDTSQLDPRFLSGEITLTKNPFFMEYLKNQTEVNKEFKEESTLSTQYRKIFDIGLYDGGVPVDAFNTDGSLMSREEWDSLSEEKKEQKSPSHKRVNKVFTHLERLVKQMGIDLLDEMGWTQEGEEFKGTSTDLITYLKKKLESQEGYTEEDLAILDVSKDQEFPDLSISPAAARLEKFLFSIVNKKMIRLKVNGDPLVQASNVGMQKFRGGNKLTDEERAKYSDKDLQGYIVTPSGTIGMKVKIAITDNYTNLYKTKYYKKNEKGEYVEDGIIAVYKTVIDPETSKPILNEKTKKPVKVLDDQLSLNRLNEMIKLDTWLKSDSNREKIQISGLRIPGQGPNSTEFGEVWEFLSASASNIIIIPAEVIAKAGGDFDVDKLSTYIKFISRQGTLLEDTLSEKEVEAELKEVDAVLKQRKADKLNISNSLDKFRKSIYKISKHINMTDEQIKSFTTRDYRRLLTTLADEKSLYFLKNNPKAKTAYNIYEKEIKGTTAVDYDGIEDILEALYSTDSELFYYTKRKSDLMDYKNNYASVIMNSLVGSIIDVQKSPEMAFSLLLPNGTYLVKPYADELKPIIQEADNLPNFQVSIKTGKKIAGRSKGVSPTRAREYNYNKDKRQGNFDAKNSLSIIALEIPLNGLFNKIGSEMEPSITETISIPDKANKAEKMDITSPLTIRLPHNYTNHGSAIKELRAISTSKLLDVKKINQVADVLSQLANGAVDAAKDNWIAYLQGNTEGISKILGMLEMGVPIGHIVYFINNPLIRKYIAIKRNKKSRLVGVYQGYNIAEYDPALFKSQQAITPALNTPIGTNSKFSMTSFWGTNNLLKGYMEHQNLSDDIFTDEQQLKEVAYSSIDTKDNNLKSKQIAGFLQYLYIEKLVSPFETIKKGIDVDTNTNVDSQTVYSKLMLIKDAEQEHILGKKTLEAVQKSGMLAMFFPVLKFAKKLFGNTVLKFRTNNELEKFIYNTLKKNKWKIRELTGYDEENFGNKFKNAISLQAFTSELKQYKEGSSIYKGTPISELFNKDSIVKSVQEVINDYTSNNYSYDSKNVNNFYARGFYPIAAPAVSNLTANDFVELILEREFLRKKIMPFTDSLKNSRHFQAIKKSIQNTNIGKTLSDEQVTNLAYEKLIVSEALLNTFNYWQMFSSNDYSVADKFFVIMDNYPEIKALYNNSAGKLLNRISSDSLKDNGGNLLSKNLKLKALKELNKDLSSEFNLVWKKLANSGDIKKAVALKNAEANKYISSFFQQLPIFMFLQSGLNSSKFSFNKIMPTEDYLNIMANALKNFEKDYLTGKPQETAVLQGMYNLFIQINNFTARPKLNRGNNYRRTKNQLLALANSPLSLYTQPYIRPTDDRRVFLLDPVYSEDGVKKKVTPAMVNTLRSVYSSDVVFLFNNNDFGITGTNLQENKARITSKIDAALASGKTIVINSDGFNENLPATPTQVQLTKAPASQKPVASIPQNKVSGIESFGSLTTANPEAIKALGPNPHSIDMVEAGFRTRTTRSVGEVAKYKVKVGDVVKQFGTSADGTTKIVYTRVTAIHPKGSPGWKGTWSKEGWSAKDVDVIDKFKAGAEAIEFEVIKEDTDTDESTTCSTPPF